MNRAYRYVACVMLLSLIGCAGPSARVEVPSSHPAHPDAPETPVPAASTTLAIQPAGDK